MSLTVTFHVTHLPLTNFLYGSSVSLSDRLPSVLSRPDGSFNAGMSAFAITIIIIIIIMFHCSLSRVDSKLQCGPKGKDSLYFVLLLVTL